MTTRSTQKFLAQQNFELRRFDIQTQYLSSQSNNSPSVILLIEINLILKTVIHTLQFVFLPSLQHFGHSQLLGKSSSTTPGTSGYQNTTVKQTLSRIILIRIMVTHSLVCLQTLDLPYLNLTNIAMYSFRKINWSLFVLEDCNCTTFTPKPIVLLIFKANSTFSLSIRTKLSPIT